MNVLDSLFSYHISGLWGYPLADILTNVGLIAATLVMALLLYKTLNHQIYVNTMSMITEYHKSLDDHHKDILTEISRNFTNKGNPKHKIIKYAETPLRKYLNELERLCLFCETRAIRPTVVFESFLPMIEPCLSDEQIKNEFDGKYYSGIQKISKWFDMYSKCPTRFKIRYLCHLL